MSDLRSVEARKADVLGVLEGQRDLWLATGDTSGRPHLIAVSAWWDGTDLVVATTAASRTAANLARSPQVRLAAGAPNDVIMIDAAVVETVAANELPSRADCDTWVNRGIEVVEVGRERLGACDRGWHARVPAGLHVEQRGHVLHRAAHRPFGAEERDPDVGRRPARHPALARPKTVDVVPAGRICRSPNRTES